MKKNYLQTAIRAVMIKKELMQFTSGEQDKTPVDPDGNRQEYE